MYALYHEWSVQLQTRHNTIRQLVAALVLLVPTRVSLVADFDVGQGLSLQVKENYT